jgi:hypothetical protein
MDTWRPIITMSNAIDSQPPEGIQITHREGGRVDVQLPTNADQLRHGQNHKLPGIKKRT